MTPPELLESLARYPAPVRPGGEVRSIGGGGGLSGSAFWRCSAGDLELVLRAWAPAMKPSRLSRIHAWAVRIAERTGLPVPVPLVDLSGLRFHSRDGRLWELSPWLPGEPDLGDPPSDSHVESAFEALGRLHASLGQESGEGPSPGIAARLFEMERLEQSEFARLAVAMHAARDDAAVADGLRWLELARAEAPGVLGRLRDAARWNVRLQPCLRDARPEHFLFEGERLSGLLDLGAMDLDSVATDLSRLGACWLDKDQRLRAKALKAYTDGRQRPPDEIEEWLIPAFESSADLLIGGHWLRWHFLEGRRFEDPGAVPRGVARGLERVTRLAGRRQIVASPARIDGPKTSFRAT